MKASLNEPQDEIYIYIFIYMLDIDIIYIYYTTGIPNDISASY